MILLNGQWQGGADVVTLNGLREIKELYLQHVSYREVPICEDTELEVKDKIIGLEPIKIQTANALSILKEEKPTTLFTVGGGCDADVASIAYLNQLYKGDLCVLWFDAHGDINSPEESSSHLFYGMPARALLSGCRTAFGKLLPDPLAPEQFIQVGGRAFDEAEQRYIRQQGIAHVPWNSKNLCDAVLAKVRLSGKTHCYIHLDLDVLDPKLFPYVPVPEKDGLSSELLLNTLKQLFNTFSVVGYGLYEFAPQNKKIAELEYLLNLGLEYFRL